MTLEECVTEIEARQLQDVDDWAPIIAAEVANGHLAFLNGRAATSQELYEMALHFLSQEPPNIPFARNSLAGALQLDQERGGGTAATLALEALAEYEATP